MILSDGKGAVKDVDSRSSDGLNTSSDVELAPFLLVLLALLSAGVLFVDVSPDVFKSDPDGMLVPDAALVVSDVCSSLLEDVLANVRDPILPLLDKTLRSNARKTPRPNAIFNSGRAIDDGRSN